MKNWFTWLKGFKATPNTGALFDTRTPEEKQKDFLDIEIASSPIPVWRTFGDANLSVRYPFENQHNTSSCVAHASVLAMGITMEEDFERFVRLSPAFFYSYRKNFPGEGMHLIDAAEIAQKIGSCNYAMLPTPETERAINNVRRTPQMVEDAKNYRQNAYVFVYKPTSIDSLNIACQDRAVVLFIYADMDEWAQTTPRIIRNVKPQSAEVRHVVTILPNSGFVEAGKKYVIIQDSAWFGGQQVRYLSEDFIAARTLGAFYFTDFTLEKNKRPRHTFTRNLRFGMNNNDVRMLQECLVHEGIHPSNAVTGFFGGITLRSVKQFQTKYAKDILVPAGLDAPTGFVGAMTIAKLNELYGK
jgi:peptidoglycan hydrolase-like protein with peptidoglycan-binding domain